MRRLRTIPALAACAVIAFLTLPVTAGQAAVTAGCTLGAISQPFLTWGDATAYELVPGGSFSGPLDGWSLSGDAVLVASAEPWGVTGSAGTQSLELGQGAVALTAATCVNVVHPTVRFFARSDTPGATIDVAAVLDDRPGSPATPVGSVAPTPTWSPSLPLAVRAPILTAHDGPRVDVQLKLTARGGTVQVDDVFIDPWRSG